MTCAPNHRGLTTYDLLSSAPASDKDEPEHRGRPPWTNPPAQVDSPVLHPPGRPSVSSEDKPFRFYDNREKYLLFVTTCSEKWVVADRVGMELGHISPKPPAIRIFDAGMGDATVLTRVMRQVHAQSPTVPMLAVAKEISLEDVRLGLEKMPDRFFEHPETVLVVTNMRYTEAPGLSPDGANARRARSTGRKCP